MTEELEYYLKHKDLYEWYLEADFTQAEKEEFYQDISNSFDFRVLMISKAAGELWEVVKEEFRKVFK